MVTRSLVDKSTTIKKGVLDNFGLNPISMLSYGVETSRVLIHFNIDKLKQQVNDKTFANRTKLKHILRLKNCASVDFKNNRNFLSSADENGYKERAVSFTLIGFKVNKPWDMGVGFDNLNDFWNSGKPAISQDASTWYNATTEETWDNDGIYTDNFIEEQLELYNSGNSDTIIVGAQKFDVGNENLNLDITNYVNRLIDGTEENNGICIMFSPELEQTKRKVSQYVGFFNEKTNTIFTPILESRYDSNVNDDRFSFYLGKNNKLYLYSIIDNAFENLDIIPTCTVNGVKYNVIQESKGIYYINIKLDSNTYKPNTILYDVWSDMVYQSEDLDDVELEFVTHPKGHFFTIDETIRLPKTLNPMVVGINNNELINQGEIRLIKVFYKVPYTHSEYVLNNTSQYRLYVKDGDREVNIIDWDNILNISKCGLFKIDTETLAPAEYHIDIKVSFGEEVRIFKNEITFKIVSNVTEQKL